MANAARSLRMSSTPGQPICAGEHIKPRLVPVGHPLHSVRSLCESQQDGPSETQAFSLHQALAFTDPPPPEGSRSVGIRQSAEQTE